MKILLATDGSDHSLLAEELLAKLPFAHSAQITVASITPDAAVPIILTPVVPVPVVLPESTEVWKELHRHVENTVSATSERLKAQGLSASPCLLQGEPANEILALAQRESFDVIVLGSRGENAFVAMLLGSVARKVLTHASCSVIIARPDRHETTEHAIEHMRSLQKLSALVAVDSSGASHRAVEFLNQAPPKSFRSIRVISVEPMMPLPPGIDPAFVVEAIPADAKAAERFAKEASGELASQAETVDAIGVVGRPAGEILESAAASHVDLVVLGATRHGALERFLLGSTSYEVATTAPCSVAVVR